MLDKVTCFICNTGCQFEGSTSSLGLVKEKTGYHSIICIDTTFKFVCPSCLVELKTLVMSLHDHLGRDSSIHWDSLRHLLTKPILKLDQHTFHDAIKTGTVVVYFKTDWASTCREFNPIFERVATKYYEHQFAIVDADKCPELARELHVSGVPDILCYAKGILSYHHSDHYGSCSDVLESIVRKLPISYPWQAPIRDLT